MAYFKLQNNTITETRKVGLLFVCCAITAVPILMTFGKDIEATDLPKLNVRWLLVFSFYSTAGSPPRVPTSDKKTRMASEPLSFLLTA